MPKPKSKKGLIIGVVAVAAVIVLAVVLILVIPGGGAVLRDYDYDDILGNYEGTLKVTSVKCTGDVEAIEDYIGYGDLDKYRGDKGDCTITLSEDMLYIESEVGALSYLEIDDFTFVKGVSKDSYEESQDGYATMS
jgi:hypothetical protein